MSTSSSIREDGSRLSRADRLLFRFESLLTLIGGLVIFLLVFFATANVLGRWIFSTPIDGYIDWIEQAMAFMAFLGIAYTQRLGGHIRMDMLIAQLHNRRLWLVEFITVSLMFLITLILIYGSWLHFWRAYTLGDSSLDINLPTWPAKLVVPVAFAVLAVRLLLQMWAYVRAIRSNSTDPVAVPLIESAAEVAAKESEALLDNTGKETST